MNAAAKTFSARHSPTEPRCIFQAIAKLVFCCLPLLTGCASTLNAMQSRGNYIVDVLPRTCVIQVRGIIPVDGHEPIAVGLQELRAQGCESMRIQIESIGGSVWAANLAGEAIRAAGAETQVDQICASACAHMFMGGTRRWVSQQAQIGVHQLSALGARSADCLTLPVGSSLELRINRLFHQTLSYERLQAFLDLQSSTSCQSMSYINATQLLLMGIATDMRVPKNPS